MATEESGIGVGVEGSIVHGEEIQLNNGHISRNELWERKMNTKIIYGLNTPIWRHKNRTGDIIL